MLIKWSVKKKEGLQQEIDHNYAEFIKLLPSLIQEGKSGQAVLIKKGKIIQYFSTITDAISAGELLYKDEVFSAQEIKMN